MATTITERQAQIAAERLTYTGEPTPRMQKAAKLIESGKASDFTKPAAKAYHEAGLPVEAAMAQAGYGARYIEGSAKTFPGVLVNAGLISDDKAKTVTPEPASAPPVKTSKERETIR